MATACRCGRPAAISVRMFSLTAFLEADFFSGIGLFSVLIGFSGFHCFGYGGREGRTLGFYR